MSKIMEPILQEMLEVYRKKRNFVPEEYLRAKAEAINEFFRTEKLDAAVLGISGGIDSALVLYLLDYAMKEKDSPIKKILPLSLPIYRVAGVSGQATAASKASLIMKTLEHDGIEIDLGPAYNAIVQASPAKLEKDLTEEEIAWAEGQMASVLRTPVLYYHAALLQAQGYKSLVVGTTNRDEGSYIGFFGKASDAMVDLQPIADIHKSEVYQLANLLKVPSEIIYATPRGDVWDNKVDEEMIGAPYDFLELFHHIADYTWYLSSPKEKQRALFQNQQFVNWFDAIQTIHEKNAHKYKVGNPARFIDVMDRKVTKGWQ